MFRLSRMIGLVLLPVCSITRNPWRVYPAFNDAILRVREVQSRQQQFVVGWSLKGVC
jgi:hypothetical protein